MDESDCIRIYKLTMFRYVEQKGHHKLRWYFNQGCVDTGIKYLVTLEGHVPHHQTISFIENLEDGLQASNDKSHLAIFFASRITASNHYV